jgi:hypothetical protein
MTALNLHSSFVPAESTTWIFFIFRSSKIRVSPTGVVSSLSPPLSRLSSGRCRHATAPCHASFPLSQDELATSASSSDNALSRHLPSGTKIKAWNPHHHRRLPSPDHSRLPSFTVIKRSSQPWSLSSPLNHVSILPPP